MTGPPQAMSWINRTDAIPPNVAWLIARDLKSRGRPIDLNEIAKVSKIPFGRVKWIAVQKSWDRVTCADHSAFLMACQITPQNLADQIRYINRTRRCSWPFAHLAKAKRSTLKTINRTLSK